MNVLKGILGEEETKEIIKRLNKEKEEANNMFMLEETLRNEMMENRNIGWREGKIEGKKEGIEEGIKNGIKRGKEEAKIQIARRMSKLGFDVKEISEIMKISEEDVNKMLDSNKLEIDENAEK